MASHSVLDIANFRAAFPAFADEVKFPDALLNAQYANAGGFISQYDAWMGLRGSTLDFALQLLLCHLLYSFSLIANGQTNTVLSGSTVADVSVSLEPPPARTGWEWWLATSPYGLQLWSLLTVQSAGGWAIGGKPELSAFRQAGGMF
jgi:hypothetical protein